MQEELILIVKFNCTVRHFFRNSNRLFFYYYHFYFFLTVENVVDDIADSRHKSFMIKYLKDWPYPHLTIYRVGQSLAVEVNGVQQRCEVEVVDSSLMQVVYQVSITTHCCCSNFKRCFSVSFCIIMLLVAFRIINRRSGSIEALYDLNTWQDFWIWNKPKRTRTILTKSPPAQKKHPVQFQWHSSFSSYVLSDCFWETLNHFRPK